jgi:hypothetical protein
MEMPGNLLTAGALSKGLTKPLVIHLFNSVTRLIFFWG